MIDLTQPPPDRWIKDTIGEPVNMVRLSHAVDMQETTDQNSQLALSILADAPSYRYGGNSSNGRTHAIWALFVLGRENEIPTQLVPLSHFCQGWVGKSEPPPLPTELLLMYAFASLRLEMIKDAKTAVLLASRRRLSAGQREDLADLVLGVTSSSYDIAPVPS